MHGEKRRRGNAEDVIRAGGKSISARKE